MTVGSKVIHFVFLADKLQSLSVSRTIFYVKANVQCLNKFDGVNFESCIWTSHPYGMLTALNGTSGVLLLQCRVGLAAP